MDMHLNKLLATCWARSDGMDMHLNKLVVTPHSVSNGLPAILVSLSALAVIGAATIIVLPIIGGFVERPSHEMASAPMSDSVVSASLKDIQSSQQQNAAALESLTQRSAAALEALAQSSAAQQADLTPLPTFAIPLPTARADVVAPRRRHRSRPSKTNVGVSVGAPLSAWQSGTR